MQRHRASCLWPVRLPVTRSRFGKEAQAQQGCIRCVQAQVGVQALRRVRRLSTLQKRPLKLQCRGIPDEAYNSEDTDIRATHQELTQTLKQIFEQAPVYLEQMRHVRTGDFQACCSLYHVLSEVLLCTAIDVGWLHRVLPQCIMNNTCHVVGHPHGCLVSSRQYTTASSACRTLLASQT